MPVTVPTYIEKYFQSLATDKILHEQLDHLSAIPDVHYKKISILSKLIILHFNDLLIDRNEISGKLIERNLQLESLEDKLCGQCMKKLSITARHDVSQEVLDNNEGNLEDTKLRLSSTESSPQKDLILAPETQAISHQTNNLQNINYAAVPETPLQEDLFYESDDEIIQSSCMAQSDKSPQTIKQKSDYQSFVEHSPIIGRTSLRNSPAVKADNICKSLKYPKPLKGSSPKNCRGKTEEALKSQSGVDKKRVILNNVEIYAYSKNDDIVKSVSLSGKSTCSSNSNEATSPNIESLLTIKNEVNCKSLFNTVPQNRFDSQISSELDDSNASPSILNMVSKRNFGRKNVKLCKQKKSADIPSLIDIPSSNNENIPVEQYRSTSPELNARGYNGSKLGKLCSTSNLCNRKSLTNKFADSQDYDTESFEEKSIMFEAARIVAAKKPIYDIKIDRKAVAKKFYKQTTLTESFRKVNSTSMVKGISEAVKRSAETKQLEDIRDRELTDGRSFNLPSDKKEREANVPNKLLSGTILTESDLLLEINASSSDAHSLSSDNIKKPGGRKRSSENSKKISKRKTGKVDLSSPLQEENNKKRKVLGDTTALSKRARPVFQPNDSFDVLPTKKSGNSPNYPVVGPVVRQKNLRKRLPAWSCKQCEEYYEGENLTNEKLMEKMKQCSRHRGKVPVITNTPQDFWKTGFSTSDSE